MAEPYDTQRSTALRYIGESQALLVDYQSLLIRAQNIAPESAGMPFWLRELRASYETLAKSLAVASAKAQL
jgi:hypothetical protein